MAFNLDLDLYISSKSPLLCPKPEVIQWDSQDLPTDQRVYDLGNINVKESATN